MRSNACVLTDLCSPSLLNRLYTLPLNTAEDVEWLRNWLLTFSDVTTAARALVRGLCAHMFAAFGLRLCFPQGCDVAETTNLESSVHTLKSMLSRPVGGPLASAEPEANAATASHAVAGHAAVRLHADDESDLEPDDALSSSSDEDETAAAARFRMIGR
jgi:hypothetical protein